MGFRCKEEITSRWSVLPFLPCFHTIGALKMLFKITAMLLNMMIVLGFHLTLTCRHGLTESIPPFPLKHSLVLAAGTPYSADLHIIYRAAYFSSAWHLNCGQYKLARKRWCTHTMGIKMSNEGFIWKIMARPSRNRQASLQNLQEQKALSNLGLKGLGEEGEATGACQRL